MTEDAAHRAAFSQARPAVDPRPDGAPRDGGRRSCAMVRRNDGSLRSLVRPLVVAGILGGAAAAAATAATKDANAGAERPAPTRGAGLVMLDYLSIPVPGDQPIDLMGFHVLGRVTDWLYVGVGVSAPLVDGGYGGFMAFDVAAHAQRRIWGKLFVDAGLALGGGGGGKDVEQSKVLSGTGGFVKGYVGLGYEFSDFSVGAHVARLKFKDSAIDDTRLNLFVQVPFTFSVGPYASAGDKLTASEVSAFAEGASEYTLTWALDNYSQIDPQGSYRGTLRVVDLQYAHHLTKSAYWYASLVIGYEGLPMYNHFVGGLGYRLRLAPRLDFHGQLGMGSGGYAREKIDTGPGLLVYPKLSAEYAIGRNLGLALSTGYLVAPKGSSKNVTYGAALSYHVQPGRDGEGAPEAADGTWFRGQRLSLFHQTETNVSYRGIDRDNVSLLSTQIDSIVGDHVYLPLQASVAYSAYLGYPGYGELLAGVGVQSRYAKGDRFQFFGQLLAGTNVHGLILKGGVGLNVGLSEQLAIHASAGTTHSIDRTERVFKADYAGLGLTYRFALPSW
jgi:hypothetical protein